MRYMLLVYLQAEDLEQCTRDQCYEESIQLTHDLQKNGHYIDAAPLRPVSTATSVRVRDGKRLVTDGPFAETREQLGGCYLIEADNLDKAVAIATQIPGAARGTIEVRPVVELEGMPPK